MLKKKKKTINVMFSGGIDSFFCLIILKILNYKIIGTHILNWNFTKKNYITNLIKDLSKILNIKIIILDFRKIYKKKIFFNFLKKYNNNLVANIDIYCNKIIKFYLFLKFFKKKNISKFVTGHFSLISKSKKKKYFIKNSKDLNRNQNYFIYSIKKKKIFNLIFLMGKNYKIVFKNFLKIYFKNFFLSKPSKGICFLENKNLVFLSNNYLYKKIKYLKFLDNFKKNFKYRIIIRKKTDFIFTNFIILEDIKLKKNINKKYLKCKLNNSKKFFIVFIRKMKKKIFLFFKNKKMVVKGQDACLYLKKEMIGGGIII